MAVVTDQSSEIELWFFESGASHLGISAFPLQEERCGAVVLRHFS